MTRNVFDLAAMSDEQIEELIKSATVLDMIDIIASVPGTDKAELVAAAIADATTSASSYIGIEYQLLDLVPQEMKKIDVSSPIEINLMTRKLTPIEIIESIKEIREPPLTNVTDFSCDLSTGQYLPPSDLTL